MIKYAISTKAATNTGTSLKGPNMKKQGPQSTPERDIKYMGKGIVVS
jgi:hypothetical protein